MSYINLLRSLWHDAQRIVIIVIRYTMRLLFIMSGAIFNALYIEAVVFCFALA